jgi:DNA-binding MarR family transcriptional regulator
MATVTLSPQLRREICRAVAHGNPWISVGEVFAYTRLPVGKEAVEDALKTLASTGVIRNRITASNEAQYSCAVVCSEEPRGKPARRNVLKFLYEVESLMTAKAIAAAIDEDESTVRIALYNMARCDTVESHISQDSGRQKLWGITEHGRRIYNPAEDLGAEVYE